VSQNLSNQQPSFDLTREEGIQSILTLINLIPDPAVIYHSGRDEILSANNPLYLLTQLGENDFIGTSIKALLPNLTDTNPISGHDKQALLRHKKQPLIPVNVRIFSLTHGKDTLLITLKPEAILTTSKPALADQAELINNLKSLVQYRGKSDFREVVVNILQHSAKVLGADVTCVYKASGTTPQLVQYAANNSSLASNLPKVIYKDTLSHLQDLTLWTAEKPPNNLFQMTASQAGMNFIVTVPLGNDSAKFGLFAAGGSNTTHAPLIQPLTELIAAYISGLMKDQVTLQNLRNLSNKIKQVVKIQNEIIANLDEGVIILSPDLTIAEINPASESLLGYANVEALRQHIDSVLIGSESLGSALSSARQGIPTLTAGDLTLNHRNGKSFPAQVMMTPVMNKDQLLAIIILIRDTSEEAQSQAANKQLEQRAILGEVTAIFAHEVRNPINAIMLAIQVMEDNLEGDAENQKWIDNIRDECNKLMYLMDSVLSFAKPLEYKMSAVDLDEMIPRILERWRPRLMRLNITSYYDSAIKRPVIEGDSRALEQVFTNLISNSSNAMSEEGGSLAIKISEPDLEEDKNSLLISLTDTGHGIPDEIKAHMFKPFVTGSSHGTGLGLAITQRIINAHKGKIEVDSFAGGTIFKIYLSKSKGLSS
jgi:PAS domain S-box-containing protein